VSVLYVYSYSKALIHGGLWCSIFVRFCKCRVFESHLLLIKSR